MSNYTALFWLLGIALVVLALAVLVLWRRLKVLSRQVAVSSSKPSPAGPSAEPVPILQRDGSRSSTREGRPSDPFAPAQVRRDVRSRVQPVSALPVITEPSDGDVTTARVASVTLAEPLIKAAAFTSGLRRALDEEHRMRFSAAFRRELRRQRKLRRRQRASRLRDSGPLP